MNTPTRRPLRWFVKVDGRTIGQPFRNKNTARVEAEEVQALAPWSYVEVAAAF